MLYQKKNFVTTTVLMACKNRSSVKSTVDSKTMELPAAAVNQKSLEKTLQTPEIKN